MTAFKSFFKIMLRYKVIIIMYTAMAIIFGTINMNSNSTETDFTETKPRIHILNFDKGVKITDDLVKYLGEKCQIVNVGNKEEELDDALFYRDVEYIIYIPESFGEDLVNNKNPEIEVKQTGSYGSELAKMNLERYLKVAQKKAKETNNEDEIVSEVHKIIEKEAKVELREKIDTKVMARLSRYYSFASYSILAITIYVLATILSVFKQEKISKRNNISSLHYKKFNRSILLASCVFGVALWFVFEALAIILIGNGVFSLNGMVYAINMFIFLLCAMCLATLIGNIIKDKNAASAMVNIIALGSSFLCGAFVPAEYLPDFVLKIGHVLPSYWYINTNGIIENCSNFSGEPLRAILINTAVLLLFTAIFITLTNIVSKKRRRID